MEAFSVLPGIYSVLFLIRKSGNGLKPWWYHSNPLLFGKWLLNRNNELAGRLTLMLRRLNSWNRHRKVVLRSFHLEGLAAREFQELNGIWPYEISTFLEAGARRGTDFLKIASHGGFIDGLSLDHSVSEKNQIIDEFSWSFQMMLGGMEAAKRRDLETAVNAFKSVLGEAFQDWNSLVSTYGY